MKKNPEKQDFLNSLPAALFGSNPFPCLSYQPQSTSSVLLLKCHCKPSVGQLNRHMRSLAKKDIPNVLCSPGDPQVKTVPSVNLRLHPLFYFYYELFTFFIGV